MSFLLRPSLLAPCETVRKRGAFARALLLTVVALIASAAPLPAQEHGSAETDAARAVAEDARHGEAPSLWATAGKIANFAILVGVLVYFLAKRLFGTAAGVAALALFLVLGLSQLDWIGRKLLSENLYFGPPGEPPANTRLERSPQTVKVWFDDPIEPGYTFLSVYDQAGARVDRQYGLGPLPRVAMMAILISRAGTCTVAFRYDTASFPAADQLEKCLQAGFDEIVELGRQTS